MEKCSYSSAVIICAQSAYQNLFSSKFGLLMRQWKIKNLLSTLIILCEGDVSDDSDYDDESVQCSGEFPIDYNQKP